MCARQGSQLYIRHAHQWLAADLARLDEKRPVARTQAPAPLARLKDKGPVARAQAQVPVASIAPSFSESTQLADAQVEDRPPTVAGRAVCCTMHADPLSISAECVVLASCVCALNSQQQQFAFAGTDLEQPYLFDRACLRNQAHQRRCAAEYGERAHAGSLSQCTTNTVHGPLH